MRTDSPFDTESAERSAYAWILEMQGEIRVWPRRHGVGVGGGTRVSPMRALWMLEELLEWACIDVANVGVGVPVRNMGRKRPRWMRWEGDEEERWVGAVGY